MSYLSAHTSVEQEFPMGQVRNHTDGPITVLGVSDNQQYVMCLSEHRGWEMWSVEKFRTFEVYG